MPVSISVPRLGWTMEEGTFVEWLARDGDQIALGQPLFVLESDKSSETIEALDAGVLRFLPDGPKPGDVVKVGQVIAVVVAAGEELPGRSGEPSRTLDPVRRETTSRLPPVPRPERSEATPSIFERHLPGRHSITPRARRIARELGIDWSQLKGSGRNGRIRERDILAAGQTAPQGRIIPHTTIRRTIATRMVAGVTQAAPVTLTTKADATNLVTLRERFRGGGLVPGYTDFLLRLTALTLRQHPLLQAQWREEGLFVPDGVHVALAVDTDAGLLAPVVADADQLKVVEIAARTRDLIERARAGNLKADDQRNATFTVTNLGMFGIDAFTPIITLPQCAVLGVGRIVRAPAVVGEQIVARDLLTLSLTFDHRVVDGAPAARFLDAVRQGVENPSRLE